MAKPLYLFAADSAIFSKQLPEEATMTGDISPATAPAEAPDLEAWLSQQVADTGNVAAVYGGFEISVNDEDAFPWASVLRHLLESDHEVWVETRDGQLVIVTQASID